MKQWIKKWTTLWRPLSVPSLSVYAASACYYVVLSLVPAGLLLFSLLSLLPDGEAYDRIIRSLLPDYLTKAVKPLEQIRSHTPIGLLSVSGFVAIWSASKSVLTVRNGLNAVMEQTEHEGFLRKRLRAMASLLLLFLFFLFILSATILSERITVSLQESGIILPSGLYQIIKYRYVYSYIILCLVFGSIYRLLPQTKLRLSYCFLGGTLSSAGCLLFSAGYSIYVNQISSYDQMYDMLGVTVLGMIWIRVCFSVILYAGRLIFLLQYRSYHPINVMRSIFFKR